MASSTLNAIMEAKRQISANDSFFVKKLLYYFELQLPPDAGAAGGQSFLFPLVIPPQSYSLSEPFTVEVTPTQGGGIYVEENGIVQRMIRLQGHTGFRPRPLSGKTALFPQTLPPEKKSYSRNLREQVVVALSGQRHFHYLQDTVFRTYGDLKRDPAYSKKVKLLFHNPKDEEHWLVVPQKFDLERQAGSFLYRYSIELLAVDAANAAQADFSEDKPLLDEMKAPLRAIKRGFDTIGGAVQDLTAVASEIKSLVKDIGKILDSVTTVLSAVSDFIEGVTALIQAPYAILESTLGRIDEALEIVANYEEARGTEFSATIDQKWREVQDGLEMLGTHPAKWETPAQETIRKIKEQQDLRETASTERIAEAEETEPPATIQEVNNLGTQLTGGDVESAKGVIKAGNEVIKFSSSRQVVVGQGETLASLAARYLDDARLWQYIAQANNLKPPFTDEQASAPLAQGVGSTDTGLSITGPGETPFPESLGVGGNILIPSFSKPPEKQPLLPVLGVQSNEPAESHFLGTDVAMVPVSGAGTSRVLYDMVWDTARGSTDVKTVSGLANMAQALLNRLVTEVGTNLLYMHLGMKRIVGMNNVTIDLELANFRAIEAIGKDPRIASVRDVKVETELDALILDVTAVLRGFTQPVTVRVTV